MSVGVAIVGCGLIGAKRAASLPDGARLVSVYDTNPRAAQRLANQAVLIAPTLAEAVTHPEVDLVVVAVTHDQLPVVGMEVVGSGRHLLLEKPAAATKEPLEKLRLAASDHGVVVRVGYNHRFHPSFLRLHNLLSTQDFGRLLWIRARYGHGGRLGYETEWRAVPERSGGGELVDQGSHLIDLSRFLVGDLDLRFAETRTDYWDMPVDDNAFLALKPRVGGFAWLHASWTEWRNTFSFEIAFERAKFEINGLGGSYGLERVTEYRMLPEMGPPDIETREYPRGDASWAREMEDVIAAVKGQPSIGATLEDAIAVWTIIEKAYDQ